MLEQGVQKSIEQSQLPGDAIPVRVSDGSVFIDPSTKQKQEEIIEKLSNIDIMYALRNLMQVMANPGYLNKSSNALWVVPNGGTVGTVTTVTGLTNIDGYQGKLLVINQNNSAWASVVRSRIS
jgi:hypothetical protein